MTYNPAVRDSSWSKINTGLYVDQAGRGHVFPDEIVAQLQVDHPEAEFTMADIDMIVETAITMIRAQNPEMKIEMIHHERRAS